MKKLLLILIFISFFSTFVDAHATQTPSSAKIVLRCADVHPSYYPTVQGVNYMGRLLKKRSNGRIEIKVYTDSSLGAEPSVIEMLRMGALDMARLSTASVADVDDELGVFVLPYLFRDDNHKWKVLNGPTGFRILDGMAHYGIVGLSFQEAGYRSFYNNKRSIYEPQDLKGLKMRVLPSRLLIKLIEFYGATPVPINYNEVFSALRAGVIDGAENNIPSYVSSNHYKVAKYYSLDRHNSIPEVLIISQKKWFQLSPADRKMIQSAARESVDYQRRLWANFELECLKKLKKEGCIVNEVDVEAFKNEIQSFYQTYAKQYQSLIDEINRQ